LQANEDRFDPVSRDEADSSVNDLPITGVGIKVLGTSNRAGLESAKSGLKTVASPWNHAWCSEIGPPGKGLSRDPCILQPMDSG
jgi:hypothetical protein